MRRGLSASAGILAIMLALAGCADSRGAGDDPAGNAPAPSAEAESPSDAPAAVATECLDGEWTADLDDLVDQLAAQLSSSGLAVTGSDASGTQTLVIGREGVLGFEAAMTFVLAIDMGSGLAMTMTQAHSGVLQASWAWNDDATAAGGTIAFSDFADSDYHVDTTVAINGTAADMPITPPSVAAANVPTTVTCEGDALTTHPEGTPFTTKWTRTG